MKTAILRINANTHKRLKAYCEAHGSHMQHTANLVIEGFLMEQADLMPDLKHPQHPRGFRQKAWTTRKGGRI